MNVALPSTLSSIEGKKALIWGLDDVLYPAKDYDLQVFYMFGQFIEFLEAKPIGSSITEELKSLYLSSGQLPGFDAIADKYDLNGDYGDQLDRLYHQVQLPLRLDLYPIVLQLFQQLKGNRQFFVLATGDPFMQLNKVKQMDWQGLDNDIKLYFVDELKFKNLDPIDFILEDNRLQPEEVVWIEYPENILEISAHHSLSTLNPHKLLEIESHRKSN